MNWIKQYKNDILLSLGIFLVGFVCGLILKVESKINEVSNIRKTINVESCILKDTLDFNCIQKHLEKHKIKFSRIILAQIKLESNNLKSNRFIKDNNLIGMRVAAQRFSFAYNSHDYGAFAKYNSIEDCILDIRAWQIQNSFFITTEEEYFNLLNRIYCTDSAYITKLKQLL